MGSTLTTGFPVYDAHGNDVATLSRNGSGGFSLGDRRTYDAWGVVRSQQSGGDPKLRYCGSLGHRADDESGLIYMRARYYEPTSGRFISEDVGGDGKNWFVYCHNDPLNNVDQSGNDTISQAFWIGAASSFVSGLFSLVANVGGPSSKQLIAAAIGFFAKLAGSCLEAWIDNNAEKGVALTAEKFMEKLLKKSAIGAFTGIFTGAGVAIAGEMGRHQGAAMLELWYIDNFDEVPG